MRDRLTVIGGSVAGLAAALVAARRGRPVDLYVDPARIGGSFAGVQVNGRRLDLGLRLFELDYERSATASLPLDVFDPVRHTHRPFIADIAAFIRDLLGTTLRRAPDPEMAINGVRTRCPLMTVDLTGLPAALSAADRALILDQLRTLPADPADHATLDSASRAQHGPRLHALLTQAVCAKQYSAWHSVIPAERRKLWAALFHPRTLIEAFTGARIGFRPHRPFCTTASGEAHPFIHHLLGALVARPEVTIIPAAPLSRLGPGLDGMVLCHFGPGSPPLRTPVEATVLALPPEPLFAAAGIPYAPQRLAASLLWVDVAQQDLLRPPSTLLVADPACPVFRISAAGESATGDQTFTIEFGAAAPSLDAARSALVRTGITRDGARLTELHRLTAPAQTAPIPANRDAFGHAQARLRSRIPAATILGSARRFGWDSLNDQIVDALFFGASRC